MPKGHFSYWNTTDGNRKKIRALIRSGHIDCLHSFGDLATTRAHAVRALEELERHNCRLKVWVDHAVAPTNLGADIMRGHGDEPGHPAYHADLTAAYGIRYVWCGRVSSIIGHEKPVSFRGIADWRHPRASGDTITREGLKHVFGWAGNRKYRLHAGNAIMRPIRLRDTKHNAYEFMRCNPHWRGVNAGDTGRDISQVLTSSFLDRLVARGGVCILYTHLGKLGNGAKRFGPETIEAFQRLEGYHRSGTIRVTTTRRLLDYCRTMRGIGVSVAQVSDGVTVDLQPGECSLSGAETFAGCAADGITVYADEPQKVQMRFGHSAPLACRVNPPDETGCRSLSVSMPDLEFPLSAIVDGD